MAHASEIVNTKGHPFVGVEWPVTGSTGTVYTVTMTDYGFECSCIAYRKCKHIKQVEQKFEDEALE
jgi:IMP dehydrogenase/GMP reductase